MAPASSRPAKITVLSGNNQTGREGELLNSPFMVRVTDAQGAGLAGIAVRWRVTDGSGELRIGLQLPGSVTSTDQDGIAKAYFIPKVRGTSIHVTAVPDITNFPGNVVSFYVGVANIAVIRFSPLPMMHCEYPGSSSAFVGPDTVAVGTTVEWIYAESMPAGECAARLASTSAPPDGVHFDSGWMLQGRRFQFVPAAAGTWEYLDLAHGTRGTLTVTPNDAPL